MIFIKSTRMLSKLTFNKAVGLTLFPFIIYKPSKNDHVLISHERIHIQQQIELLILPFYILYLLEYILRLICYFNFKKAYEKISFEQEAYQNESNLFYYKERKRYSWLKYF